MNLATPPAYSWLAGRELSAALHELTGRYGHQPVIIKPAVVPRGASSLKHSSEGSGPGGRPAARQVTSWRVSRVRELEEGLEIVVTRMLTLDVNLDALPE